MNYLVDLGELITVRAKDELDALLLAALVHPATDLAIAVVYNAPEPATSKEQLHAALHT